MSSEKLWDALAALDYEPSAGFCGVGDGFWERSLDTERQRVSTVTEYGGDRLPETYARSRVSVGIFTRWIDGAEPWLEIEFASVKAWTTARDADLAFRAWSKSAKGTGIDEHVRNPDDAMAILTERRVPLLTAFAAKEAQRDGRVEVAAHTRNGDMFVGLFAPSLVRLDLSSHGFWIGPGAWVIPLLGDVRSNPSRRRRRR